MANTITINFTPGQDALLRTVAEHAGNQPNIFMSEGLCDFSSAYFTQPTYETAAEEIVPVEATPDSVSYEVSVDQLTLQVLNKLCANSTASQPSAAHDAAHAVITELITEYAKAEPLVFGLREA